MTLFEAACELAAKVGPVMPVVGKRPTQPDWPNQATRTPTDGPEWRAATGIGLLTGARAGYFVLDVDGAKGAAALAALESQHGPLPTTWVSRTGGGGMHFFFKHPGWPVRGSAGKLGPGLDVRGEGGQVVVPPSAHPSGTTYEWQLAPWAMQPPPAAPAWLLDLLRPKPELVAPPRPAESDVLKRAAAYLARIPGAVSGSGGHDQAWKAALAVVRGFALSESDAYALLATDFNPRCTPPWSEKELRHKVKQASQSAGVTWGYLRDAERPTASASKVLSALSPPAREPGSDDDTDTPAIVTPRFQVEQASSLLAEVIPPAKWLLAPYVPECSFGELVGPPGKGKTTFMAWMIAQMAAAGHRCCIVEEEGSRRGLQRLLRRALATVGQDAVARVGFMHATRANLQSQIDIEALAVALKGYDFVLFDSFHAVTPGLDEDKAKDMGPVTDNIVWLIREVNTALWLNHHSGKSHWRDGEVPMLGDGRGSSALPGKLDAELSMRPCESAQGFIEFDLFVTKMREGDDQVKPQHVRIDRAGDAATCEMEELAVAESAAKPSAVDKLTDLLMRDARVPTSYAEAQPAGTIAKNLKVDRSACFKAIKALCDDGMFEANAVTAKPYKKYHRCNE